MMGGAAEFNCSISISISICILFFFIISPSSSSSTSSSLAASDASASPAATQDASSYLRFSGEEFTPWDPTHLKLLNNGSQLQLLLDESSGSGISSKDRYMFGSFEIQMKVAAGDTAGTVTAFYLSSAPETPAETRDELDFEFLGNVSGEPYLLQTNIFTNGTGYKEQRIYLWFDPTADFHTYTISWTKDAVIFLVDGIAIRKFANAAKWGQLYVDKHAMGAYLSIWNGDDWATRGGLVKINWTAAPFVASYQHFRADACVYDSVNATMCMQSTFAAGPQAPHLLAVEEAEDRAPPPRTTTPPDVVDLRWIDRNNLVVAYDYCQDRERFPRAPIECVCA